MTTGVRGMYHVYVYNMLGENENLWVHCSSKDDDLGIHLVPYQSDFHWKFNVNIFRTTLFSCDLAKKTVSGHFVIFNAKRDDGNCKDDQCIWHVKKDGIYFYNAFAMRDELKFRWP
ncbi:PREDICTED: pumilio homolog 15-like [Nelumbo nucifera]|nr:PREDICTED: pumilio homolog 15-like [Nelumbo nucifera]